MPKVQRVTDFADKHERLWRQYVLVDQSLRTSHQDAGRWESGNQGQPTWKVTFLVENPNNNQDGQGPGNWKEIIEGFAADFDVFVNYKTSNWHLPKSRKW